MYAVIIKSPYFFPLFLSPEPPKPHYNLITGYSIYQFFQNESANHALTNLKEKYITKVEKKIPNIL